MSKFNFGTTYTLLLFTLLLISICAGYYKYVILQDFKYLASTEEPADLEDVSAVE